MNSEKNAERTAFGQRNEPHRIVISHGDTARSFTVRPRVAGIALSLTMLVITGYLGATGYLIFRDHLIANSKDLRADVRSAYEDRIARLRAQNDRIASQQLIEHKTYEEKIKLLLARQRNLDQQQDRVAAVIDRAAKSGLDLAYAPLPEAKPQQTTTRNPTHVAIDTDLSRGGLGGETQLLNERTGALGLRGSNADHLFSGTGAEQPVLATGNAHDDLTIIDTVSTTLGQMDKQTSAVLDAIAVSAERRIDHIEDITAPLGLELIEPAEATGGLFVPLDTNSFDARLNRADRAIDRLGALRRAIDTLPLAQPVPRAKVTSRFGQRLDPFERRPAMHTGIDFKAEYGTAVRATAAGTIVSAGRNGGYGLMVAIDHGNGLVTRYAHMSRIRVAKGTRVAAGKIIGNIGSTGRSTGPHLHYETRMRGVPRDPNEFLDVGNQLSASLK